MKILDLVGVGEKKKVDQDILYDEEIRPVKEEVKSGTENLMPGALDSVGPSKEGKESLMITDRVETSEEITLDE